MPRATPTSNPKSRHRKHAPKTTGIESDNLSGLQEICEAEVSKYNSVKNTDAAYQGHLSRAKGFLKNLVVKMKKDEELHGPSDGGICIAALEKAFDEPAPNKYLAHALEMFLIQKCFNEGCGKDTADGIHAAFAMLWDNMDGEKYAGEYCFNEATGEVKGCPARASSIKAVVQSIKTCDKSKGASATRNHAEAMTLEELQHLMRWSAKECPDEWLTDERWKSKIEDTVAALKLCLQHGFMRGFMSSGFTLWTRCFELLSLQARDLKENCVGPAPYYIPHFKVELLDRKGWQHEKGYSCMYDIYKQAIPEMDMHTHLLRWKSFLENVVGRKLAPEDYLFPHIGINGGAQYRFVFAPLGQRWSLNRIRWWGGWAIGEHCDTLIKYLVDSLQSFENSHGDALHPIPIEPGDFFLGDHIAMKPATAEEVHQLGASVNENICTLATTVQSALSQTTWPSFCGPGLARLLASGRSRHITSINTMPANAVSHQVDPFQSGPPTSSCSSRSRSVSPSTLPLPGVSIPSLGPLKQWTEVDPETGLALKDWPAKWYSGLMRDKTGSLRSQRELLFMEYQRLGGNDNQFLEAYPDANRSLNKLIQEIRKRTRPPRVSKNGTPEARSSVSRNPGYPSSGPLSKSLDTDRIFFPDIQGSRGYL
ncbi:hypothetical protein BDZ97DRAFT_1906545 [Flammula alnicola]|nr:hypothetical protein BDZ97DRAFT_1906545 [Flammula alnicola]